MNVVNYYGYKHARVVRSSWLQERGRRLDCTPYMSGALEARDALRRLPVRKDALHTVTAGYAGGIYNGPMFKRNYVDSPEYGVPFISSGSMLLADLSNLPLLRRKDAESSRLSYLRLQSGTTLISCSGTVGRMAYVRPDMDGMWSSQDVMKVVPDATRIPPGYLYAFLSSRYGVPLVVSGTYGAIIQHIEPEHISNLPVPRVSDSFESEIHELIMLSASKRSRAQKLLNDTLYAFEADSGLSAVGSVIEHSTSFVASSKLDGRIDAPYHCAPALSAEQTLLKSRFGVRSLQEVVARYFKPPIFKRLWVDSEEYGRLFVSGVDIYRHQAEERRYVSRRTPRFNDFILKRGWVAFQAAGQIYGLFGRPLYVNGWLENTFCADDVFRIVPRNEIDGAFLYLFLRTSVGKTLIKRQACGNSIPRVWEPHISKLRVVWPDRHIRERFAAPIVEAHEMIEAARLAETKAIMMIEDRIDESA